MDFAAIKDATCVNVMAMDEASAATVIPVLIQTYAYDEVIPLLGGFGVGDFYKAGKWESAPRPEPEIPAESGE